MASFSHISGAEPSTITFKVATIVQTRNSSAMQQEIVSIGDPDSSNAVVAVLNAAPASTAWGIVTRDVASRYNIGSTAADNAVLVSGNSTVFQGGTWTIRANLSSTSADNPVTVSGNSTVFQGGTWTVGGASTVAPIAGSTWNTRPIQSSAADLQMTATPAAGSTWNVRALNSSAGDLLASVQPIAGSTWRTQPGSTAWASSAGFHFDSSGGLQISGSITASASTGPITVSQLLDSSGGSVTAADSANNAIRVNVVAGAAGGSTIVTVSAFGAGLLSSGAVGSNSSALNVRVVGFGSSAADFPVQISGNSTAVISAFAAGLISSAVQAGGSSALTVRNVWSSTNTDQPVSAAQAGTWTFTLGTNLQSSAAPSSNSSGLVVRQVVDNVLTTASTSAFAASTALSIQSSGAGLRSYVTAYSILTTNAGPTKIAFYSSGTMVWPLVLAAVSSAVTGANLAVGPPGYLFRTNNQEALTLQTKGSTVAGWSVAVSYFRAP